jgi:hypothetical protein
MAAASPSRRWATRANTLPAVSFQTELTLQGLVDGFDPLTNAAEVAVAVGLVLAVRTQ